MSTPRLPAEWEAQQCIIFTWPHPSHNSIWTDDLQRIDKDFAFIIEQAAHYSAITIIAYDTEHKHHIESLLASMPTAYPIQLLCIPTNDCWVRDYGPITLLTDEKPLFVNFGFDAWGGKYPHLKDSNANAALFSHPPFTGYQHATVDYILEGGSIETDGHGTLLTTEQCVFTHSRNPATSRPELIKQICTTLNASRLLILKHGKLIGDDTDGHIDTLVRFVDPHTLCYTACDDKNNAHYRSLKMMEGELAKLTDYLDNPYRLVPLPLPPLMKNSDGEPLPANYTNFLILNGAVLVPTYDTHADNIAQMTLQQCFPNRKIIPIPSTELIQNFGSIHCASMHIPKGNIHVV